MPHPAGHQTVQELVTSDQSLPVNKPPLSLCVCGWEEAVDLVPHQKERGLADHLSAY